MSLSRLPPELILRIFDFLDPGSHLAFALTSRQVCTYSKDILQHHWECHSRYRICTDKNWRIVEDTLRAVGTDPIAAWHLRYFRAMFTWEQGVEKVDEETVPLGDTIRDRLRAIDLEQLLDLELETTISLMLRRSCEATQALLFALCSGLDTVDLEFFPLPFGKSWRNEKYDLPAPRIHNCFTSIIRVISNMHKPLWPPGFQSLRRVFVNDERTEVHPLNVAPLFLLPAIETLHICNMRLHGREQDHEDDATCENMLGPDSVFTLPPKSSTIQHLCLEDVGPDDIKYTVSRIIESAKELKTTVFVDCDFDDFDLTVSTLDKSKKSSLETLLWYGKRDKLHGYPCSKFQPGEALEGFQCLRNVTIDMSDIRLGSLSPTSNGEQDGLSGNCGTHDDFVGYFKESIPASVEVLIFQTESGVDGLNDKDIAAIDDAIVALLEDECCPNLRAIHLEKVERIQRADRAERAERAGEEDEEDKQAEENEEDRGYGEYEPKTTWFQSSVECARERRINVYTVLEEDSTEGCIFELCDVHFRERINPKIRLRKS